MSETVYVVQWEDEDGLDAARHLRATGWPVELGPGEAQEACRRISNCLPLAVVIPLDPDPELGCGLACQMLADGATSRTPIVFVGGMPDSVDIAKNLVPDAMFSDTDDLAALLETLKRRQ